jgi:methanethiol S-methyltransferase
MAAHYQTISILVLAWVAYGVVHSWLASLQFKRFVAARFPRFMPAYRLCFNGLALLLLIPPLWLTYTLPGPRLWQWQGLAWGLANGLALLAVAGVFWSLRDYDGSEFLGLRQWREGITSVEDQERFHISTLHRFVRHPWYSLGLVLVWTRDMDLPFLITAIVITLYFITGSRLEERKLMVYHGDQYRRYRSRVPALLPLPWRYLTRAQARQLLDE